MRLSTLAPAVIAILITLGYADEGKSAVTTNSTSGTPSDSTESSSATTEDSVTDATSSATSVPIVAFVCGAAQKSIKSGQPKVSSLTIGLVGNDATQTFTWGSKFAIDFDVVSTAADAVVWQVTDYAGIVHASGTINVSEGTTTASLGCSSTRAGYFAVSAKLRNSGVTQRQQGSRPAGFVSFGVLPNVADYVPDFNASLDQHRFGIQGAAYAIPSTNLQPLNENLGITWVLSYRSQAQMEPQNSGQYNPANQRIDDSMKVGTLARVISLNGIPQWASTAPSEDSVGSYPPRSFSAYQTYMALVGQESARIHTQYIPHQAKNYYQVTWEPDPGPATEWKGSDAQFVALYKAVWEGVHSTDPDAAVMGPTTMSLPACADWLSRLAPLGYTKYLDAVACHGYYTIAASSALPPEPADLPGQVQQMRKTMVGLMPAGTKLIVTETGISYPMGSHYSASYPTAEVLKEHAEAVVRTHLIMLGEGVDTSFLFYASDYTNEVGFGQYFNLDMHTENYNPTHIEPKPSALAVAAATRLVDGSRSLGALTNLPSGEYGYAFMLADKLHVMTALWAHNGSFNASDTYQLAVDYPGTSGHVLVFDTMGNPKSVAYSNGFIEVALSEMPTYVLTAHVGLAKLHARAPQGYSTSF
jgi:hypothetical protein